MPPRMLIVVVWMSRTRIAVGDILFVGWLVGLGLGSWRDVFEIANKRDIGL